MNFKEDYSTKEHSSYFVVDVDRWCQLIHLNETDAKQPQPTPTPLGNEEKIALARFLIKDVYVNYAIHKDNEIVFSLDEHDYDQSFEEPFVITPDTDVVPLSSKDNIYFDRTVENIRMAFDYENCGGNYALMSTARVNLFNHDDDKLNRAGEVLPEWVGKVVIKRRTGLHNHEVLVATIEQVTVQHTLKYPVIRHYSF